MQQEEDITNFHFALNERLDWGKKNNQNYSILNKQTFGRKNNKFECKVL
jgi:hypothetical protein